MVTIGRLGPLPRAAPAARLAAPRRGQAARAGVAPVVPHRAAHVLRRRSRGPCSACRTRTACRPPRFGVPRRGQRRAGPVPRRRTSRRRAAPAAAVPERRCRAVRGRTRSSSGAVPEQAPAAARAAPAPPTSGPTVLETIIAALAGQGRARAPGVAAAARPAAAAGRGARRRTADRGCRCAVGADRPCPTCSGAIRWSSTSPGASGHLAVVGGPRAGKSSGLASVVLGLALTHAPAEIGVHVLDFGGGALRPLAGLPHVGTVADRQEADLVRRTVAELVAALAVGSGCSARPGSPRSRRSAPAVPRGSSPTSPPPTSCSSSTATSPCARDFDDLEARLLPLAAQGLAYGLHLAVSATRWSELRPAAQGPARRAVGAAAGRARRVGGRPAPRRRRARPPRPRARPRRRPARARRPRGAADADAAALVGRVAGACHGPGFAPVRLLPVAHRRRRPARPAAPASRSASTRTASPASSWIRPPSRTWCASPMPRAARPRCCGSSRRGSWVRCTPEQARVIVVDPRRGLLGDVPDTHLIGYASTAEQTSTAARTLAESLRKRLPGPAGHPARAPGAQLVARPRGLPADRRLRPRRAVGHGRAPAAAARGVPATGQGRRPARGRRPAVRRGRAGALRPAPGQAPRARRTRPGAQREPGRGRAGGGGQGEPAAAGPRRAGRPAPRRPARPARVAGRGSGVIGR